MVSATGAMAQRGGSETKKSRHQETRILTRLEDDATTVEISGDGVYVDGELVASRSDLEQENISKKIIIRKGGERGSSRGAGRAMLGVMSKSDYKGTGALVSEVSEDSPADEAGLKEGDIITRIDTTAITDAGDLVQTILSYDPGDKVTVTYLRDNKTRQTTATLVQRMEPGVLGALEQMPNAGRPFMLPRDMRPFSFDDDIFRTRRPKLGIAVEDRDEGEGVMVRDVKPGTPADKSDIRSGDVITRIDNENIRDVAELLRRMDDVTPGSSLKAEILRDGARMYKTITIPKEKRSTEL